jgi:hypothetical protein
LDNSQTFVLNDYYIADPDDFTSGYVNYPMTGLSPGKHTIVVKGWDTYNNPAEASIDFIVTDGKQIVIESFGSYPNPASEKTTFYFTHNRFGDDLQAEIYIFNAHGMVQKTLSYSIAESSYRVEFPELDLKSNVDKYLAPGLYLVRLVIRSVTNASKNEQVTKLIILN